MPVRGGYVTGWDDTRAACVVNGSCGNGGAQVGLESESCVSHPLKMFLV